VSSRGPRRGPRRSERFPRFQLGPLARSNSVPSRVVQLGPLARSNSVPSRGPTRSPRAVQLGPLARSSSAPSRGPTQSPRAVQLGPLARSNSVPSRGPLTPLYSSLSGPRRSDASRRLASRIPGDDDGPEQPALRRLLAVQTAVASTSMTTSSRRRLRRLRWLHLTVVVNDDCDDYV
jgi:hypothetical protein